MNSQQLNNIPKYYDRHTWETGKTNRMRVGHVYDPSKFWIVMMPEELDVFQSFLMDKYKKISKHLKIPIKELKKSMYCVAFTDDAFYRGFIVDTPYFPSGKPKARVFLFDFGYMAAVELDCLYYLYEKMYQVPQFAVRASLIGIRPYDTATWSYKVVQRFKELVTGKILLCILACTDSSRKMVFITIGDVKDFAVVSDIGDILINEKLAQSILTKESAIKLKHHITQYSAKTKYPYLFPSFEAIEGGLVPSSVYATELLMQSGLSDILSAYYSHDNVNE